MEEHLNHKSLPVRYNYTVLSGREDFRSEEHMQSLSPHAASRFYRAVYHFLTTFSVGAIFCIMMSLWDLNRLTSNDMSVSSLVTAAIDKTANLYFGLIIILQIQLFGSLAGSCGGRGGTAPAVKPFARGPHSPFVWPLTGPNEWLEAEQTCNGIQREGTFFRSFSLTRRPSRINPQFSVHN